MGDAELDEGSNDEAIVYAAAAGLPNLVVVAVDNRSGGAARGEQPMGVAGGTGPGAGCCGRAAGV